MPFGNGPQDREGFSVSCGRGGRGRRRIQPATLDHRLPDGRRGRSCEDPGGLVSERIGLPWIGQMPMF